MSIEVRHLSKTYKTHVKHEGLSNSIKSLFKREYKERVAVNDVSFSLAQGELVGMLGANGAGKTTTLKMLSGLLYPSSGSASVLGYTPWERSNAFKQQFSIVMGQRNQLWWDLPAADSFLLNKEIYRIPDAEFKRRRDELAERLNVADKLHVQVRRLSLGERMKCELIGSLLHAPRVLFLDEPTIGLDVVAQKAVRDFIREYKQTAQTTIILTSHYMADYVDEKLLTVVFHKPVERRVVEQFGVVAEYAPERVLLRVRRTSIAAVAATVLNDFPVADLTIEEVPIEEVIRKVL